VEVLVLSGSLFSVWHASSGLFAGLDFGPSALFLFLALSWVLSFYKVWQGFIRLTIHKAMFSVFFLIKNPGSSFGSSKTTTS
jgi:hypothetical protein